MTERGSLQRFVDAQNAGGTYDRALGELRRGRKTSHWMWFVFPQITGLGRSTTAQHYAIASMDEARAYLGDPVLGARLIESTTVVADLPDGTAADDVFGGIDAVKLRSSVTLFARADPTQSVFRDVLDRFFDGVPDPATEHILSDHGANPEAG